MFSAKEKVIDYLYKILSHFKVTEFNEIVPEFFQMSFSHFEKKVLQTKVKWNTSNLTKVLLLEMNKANLNATDILLIAFDLELEHIIRHSHHFQWYTNKFYGTSTRHEIYDLRSSILAAVRDDQKDALVLLKKYDNLFFISIALKNLKKIGIYEKPRYLVVSDDGTYLFNKDQRSSSAIEYVMTALGYEKCKTVKLSGKSLSSLMKLLKRKETADPRNRPVYQGGKPIELEHGLDFTQKKHILDFYDECVDTDIQLQNYTVRSIKSPWVGDDNPILSEMEFKSAITLTGDVAQIIRGMTLASIVRPPIPEYLRDFSIEGRNMVSLKPNCNGYS